MGQAHTPHGTPQYGMRTPNERYGKRPSSANSIALCIQYKKLRSFFLRSVWPLFGIGREGRGLGGARRVPFLVAGGEVAARVGAPHRIQKAASLGRSHWRPTIILGSVYGGDMYCGGPIPRSRPGTEKHALASG